METAESRDKELKERVAQGESTLMALHKKLVPYSNDQWAPNLWAGQVERDAFGRELRGGGVNKLSDDEVAHMIPRVEGGLAIMDALARYLEEAKASDDRRLFGGWWRIRQRLRSWRWASWFYVANDAQPDEAPSWEAATDEDDRPESAFGAPLVDALERLRALVPPGTYPHSPRDWAEEMAIGAFGRNPEKSYWVASMGGDIARSVAKTEGALRIVRAVLKNL